ncbi:hypothetical protein AAW14_25240 [Streptomyces hygroscopicus]|uniref:hypothetical protein n=1 Tax=Streptomyces hygroscopicus TaxID=1912 RepID=UPI00223F396A|nr:hypothetical protein [Streptomyces hygroscopicus]MCW7945207.1 hypothetical protein [Streptomyces hygroscopicus]
MRTTIRPAVGAPPSALARCCLYRDGKLRHPITNAVGEGSETAAPDFACAQVLQEGRPSDGEVRQRHSWARRMARELSHHTAVHTDRPKGTAVVNGRTAPLRGAA